MESWLKISILLCIFGVIKEFRPSEPYVTKYLTNPPMNFTDYEVSNKIYPVSIYTTMIAIVIVFLLTDLLRYKPMIIVHSTSAVVTFFMLIVVRSVFLTQVLEMFYGIFMASEVAYYTYIYAKVDKRHYQAVSSHTRAAYLIGRFLSGVVSQVAVSLGVQYYYLNYYSLGGMICATLWAFLLPPVATSLYFSRSENSLDSDEQGKMIENTPLKKKRSKFMTSIRYILADLKQALCNFYILKWMFWWALATCGYYQILTYIQLLWEQILRENNTTVNSEWNGLVEAIYTLCSAFASVGCGLLALDWKIYGEPFLFACSLLIAVLLFLMSKTNEILFAYATYVSYTIIYNGMITIANSEIATYLNPDSHGLVFGFTLFMALVFQSLLTYIVNTALPTSHRPKFFVFGCYFAVLGLVFGVTTTIKIVQRCLRRKRQNVTTEANGV